MDNSKIEAKSRVAPIMLIFLIMTLTAICDSVRGVFIPVFKEDFLINNTSIGIMLTIASLGYIIFTYIGGILCERLGQKKVYSAGFVFVVLALLQLAVSPNFFMLLISMFLLNVGQAFLGISTNTLVPVLFLSFQAVFMNLTHFCYGLGSAFGQRTAGIMLYKGIEWRKIYLIIAIYAGILFLFLIFVKIPEIRKSKNSVAIDKKNLLRNKLIYFYIFALGFYVFAEVGTGNWFVNFMEKNYNYDQSKSSLYIAIFFTVFAIGRFIGGFIIERTGYINTVLVSSLCALVLYTVGLSLGSKGVIIISMAGLFFSIVFPTIVLTINKVFRESSAYITGIIITFSSATNMVMNLLMGYLNDRINIYIAYWLIPISLLISIIFIYLIYINTKEKLLKN